MIIKDSEISELKKTNVKLQIEIEKINENLASKKDKIEKVLLSV